MRPFALVILVLLLPSAAAAARPDLERGRDLYLANCLQCHGPRGEGVEGRGPALTSAGASSADFYLRTGRMPLVDPADTPERSAPSFDEDQLDDLVAFVAALGKGPAIPEPRPERGRLAEGLRLFTENCAGCHQIAGEGGAVTGARVPPLGDASAVQIAEAVRIGPYVMPRYSERRLSDAELDSIIRYVLYARDPLDEGGWGIGHIGPIPEGIVTWLLAAAVLVAACSVIGRRLRR
jgi:ubiquinol-cytochrome c reductase cytochrome c subunit